MTFEEAWPHIKAGKEFRYKVLGEWSQWHSLDTGGHGWSFDILMKKEFEIKPEPREFVLRFDGEGELETIECPGASLITREKIKVREVIE